MPGVRTIKIKNRILSNSPCRPSIARRATPKAARSETVQGATVMHPLPSTLATRAAVDTHTERKVCEGQSLFAIIGSALRGSTDRCNHSQSTDGKTQRACRKPRCQPAFCQRSSVCWPCSNEAHCSITHPSLSKIYQRPRCMVNNRCVCHKVGHRDKFKLLRHLKQHKPL